MNHAQTTECIQLLSDSVREIFNLIDKELDKCIAYTNGCGLAMLIDAFKLFLKNYVDEFKRIVINLKERKQHHLLEASPQSQSLLHTSSSGINLNLMNNNNNEDWESFRHFVRIIQIVGDLIIKYEELEVKLEKQIQSIFLHNQLNDVHSNLVSILNYKEYLLQDTDRIKLNRLITVLESGDDYNMMKDLLKPMYSLSESVHKYAFEIVFAPVKHLIKNLAKSNIWSRQQPQLKQDSNSVNVPLFAFAPQEYITKIGQYLLTLPQNFEPFTMQDNANLIVALHKGKLPYLDVKDLSDDITACWLDSIANATAITFTDEILNIGSGGAGGGIVVNSQRQLIIDIEFICSVFEDVGLKEYANLLDILQLLKCSVEDFDETSKNKSARIVSTIKRMRIFILELKLNYFFILNLF
jgi:hypothetical protein